MSNKIDYDKAVEYVNEHTDKIGVTVVTASDGWVFSFSKEILQKLLNDSEKSGKAVIFVQRSDLKPKN